MKIRRVLVVSPHPDDETLGAGGTLLKYKARGDEIFWLNITNMKTEYGYSQDLVDKRNREIKRVAELYGFNGIYNLELEPAGLDKYKVSEVIMSLSKIISEVKPNVLLLPYKHDIHSDHLIVFNWLMSCTKSFRYPFITKILAMEILSETDFAVADEGFVPNFFVDISEHWEEKMKILNVYESEIHNHPFPRSEESTKSLALLRGASAGVRYAEAFKIIKEIDKDI